MLRIYILSFFRGNLTKEKDSTFGGVFVRTGLNELGSSKKGGASTCLQSTKSKSKIHTTIMQNMALLLKRVLINIHVIKSSSEFSNSKCKIKTENSYTKNLEKLQNRAFCQKGLLQTYIWFNLLLSFPIQSTKIQSTKSIHQKYRKTAK